MTRSRPTFCLYGALFGSLLFALGALTACAQETPVPPVTVATGDDGSEEPPRSLLEILDPVTANEALDQYEALLNGGDLPALDVELSLIAYSDSAQHFARTLALLRRVVEQDPHSYTVNWLMAALTSMAPWRPTYRTLLRDAIRDGDYNGMAAAMIRGLAVEPRADEMAELRAINNSVRAAGLGTMSNVLTVYGSSLGMRRRYEALPTFEARLAWFQYPPTGRDALHFRELHRQRPVQVEAWIDNWTWPPQTPGNADGVLPPLDEPRRHFRLVLTAPERLLPPEALNGPLQPSLWPPPLCNGQVATVYVTGDGHVAGGQLDGQPYAGVLRGSSAADVIVGTAGPDVLLGRGGADRLCGGPGDDAISGDGGPDTADGGPGTDGCDAETSTACDGPIPTLVRGLTPLAECVVVRSQGGYRAYFGYVNEGGTPGRVPYGADNTVTLPPITIGQPEEVKTDSPDLFAVPGVVAGEPGRTPPYPGYAFTVLVTDSRPVTWTLLGQDVTLSPASPVCGAPPTFR